MATATFNASGDSQVINNISSTVSTEDTQLHTGQVSGPMGDAPQKRPLEDADEPGPKKLASLSFGAGIGNSVNLGAPALGMQAAGAMSETIRLPDDLVGLIIGRAGENIMRMQRETGCRIQITQSIPGTKERPCTLSGTQEQIEVCRNMLNEIVERSQAGTLGNGFGANQNQSNAGAAMGGMGDDGTEKSIEVSIPPDKCGLIIGKGGETIKMLQQSLGVKMLLIQDSTENVGQNKPLRISGPQASIDNAVNAVQQMMAQRDQQIAQQKLERDPNMDNNMFGDDSNKSIIPVPKAAVGVVIGKGGDMINQIQTVTGTRVQFKPEDPNLPERMCSISGPKVGVDQAIRRIHEIIQNVQERDGNGGGMNFGGGGGGGMGGGQGGGMGSFGQWEGPGMGRGGRNMGGVTSEEHLVPANKTGLVIGKGGETIKQINSQSGAHAEIQRNPPPGSDINYKTFTIKGTPDQIKLCRRLIQEKVDGGPGGNGGNVMGNSLGGPPPNNFAPPPQQAGYGGIAPTSYGLPNQGQLQAPPQVQPNPSYPQPWGGNQFQQWNPNSAVSNPAQNGADPGKAVLDTNTAAIQSYLQIYGQAGQTQAYQQPTASAAPTAAVAAASATHEDYTKQWNDYFKQTGVVQSGDRQQVAVTPGTVAAGLPQQVATPTPTAAGAQPATTQATADYSAAWAEYYRQYYAMQGQAQYAAAAAAGQPPAQP